MRLPEEVMFPLGFCGTASVAGMRELGLNTLLVVGLSEPCAVVVDTFELVRQRSATPGVVPWPEVGSIGRIFAAESLPPKNWRGRRGDSAASKDRLEMFPDLFVAELRNGLTGAFGSSAAETVAS
ncbi:MAG: hypothetical protein RLY14_3203 [Planctomycetota bacterium]|jgi:hypothetical protein